MCLIDAEHWDMALSKTDQSSSLYSNGHKKNKQVQYGNLMVKGIGVQG